MGTISVAQSFALGHGLLVVVVVVTEEAFQLGPPSRRAVQSGLEVPERRLLVGAPAGKRQRYVSCCTQHRVSKYVSYCTQQSQRYVSDTSAIRQLLY